MSFELACTIKHETDDAILLYYAAADEQYWIPFSQIDKITRYPDGHAVVEMSDWIARTKGLL